MNQKKPPKAKPERPEDVQADLAPEMHNDEQAEDLEQAQQVTEDARQLTPAMDSPTESEKGRGDSGLMDDSTQDTVDRMKDMEQSGRIDMDAYRGEPNMDDNEDKYGEPNKLDDLPGDGTTERNEGR